MVLESIEKCLRTIVFIKNPEKSNNLLKSIKDLDVLVEKNRDSLPKRLVHFLEKRSYDKAVAFIAEEME